MLSQGLTLLDSYFDRVAYGNRTDPVDSTLIELHKAQSAKIPFENFDIHLNRSILLNEDAVFDKLVTKRRGGLCYELNVLLGSVLRRIGFSVKMLAGRTTLGMSQPVAKTHMTLLVRSTSGEWIVDAGFGGCSLSGAIPFSVGTVYDTGSDRYRLLKIEAAPYLLQWQSREGWRSLYEFTSEPLPLVDFEIMNYYNATNPNSRFRRSVVAACVGGGRRTFLRGLRLRVSTSGGSDEWTIRTPDAFENTLATKFGISLGPDIEGLFARAALEESA